MVGFLVWCCFFFFILESKLDAWSCIFRFLKVSLTEHCDIYLFISPNAGGSPAPLWVEFCWPDFSGYFSALIRNEDGGLHEERTVRHTTRWRMEFNYPADFVFSTLYSLIAYLLLLLILKKQSSVFHIRLRLISVHGPLWYFLRNGLLHPIFLHCSILVLFSARRPDFPAVVPFLTWCQIPKRDTAWQILGCRIQ